MTKIIKFYRLGDPDFDTCECPKCGDYTFSGGYCSNCEYDRD